MGCFVKIYGRRSLEFHAEESKVMVLVGMDGLVWKVLVDGRDWIMCQFNTWGLFWINHVQMVTNVIGSG